MSSNLDILLSSMFYGSYRNSHPNLFTCYVSIKFSLCNITNMPFLNFDIQISELSHFYGGSAGFNIVTK